MTGAFDAWLGRVEEGVDVISPRQARQMEATLGVAFDGVGPPRRQ